MATSPSLGMELSESIPTNKGIPVTKEKKNEMLSYFKDHFEDIIEYVEAKKKEKREAAAPKKGPSSQRSTKTLGHLSASRVNQLKTVSCFTYSWANSNIYLTLMIRTSKRRSSYWNF
jgi:hypothetical protein